MNSAEGKVQSAELKAGLQFTNERVFAHHSSLIPHHFIIAALLAVMMGGCSSEPKKSTKPGGYYLDDGPGANPPANLDRIPDAVPRVEPINRGTARPYVVMGRSYTPMTALAPYRARGIASWYGRRYHGKKTSSGEVYDMYAMTAAHTILPIPSYARVTNIANGKSVVVRINDRGPFVQGRIIDLSYSAAHRLGVVAGGNAMVEVVAIIPDGARYVPTPSATAPIPGTPSLPEPAPPPLTSGTGGVYVQLGAFGSRENAESFMARMRAQVDWIAESLHLFARDGLFRVQAGPYPDQGEARQAADRVSQALGVRPMVLVR